MLRAPLLAISFLTRVPVPLRRVADGDHGRALVCFPLVGALLGGLQLACMFGLRDVLSPALNATLMLATLSLVTGALHLDSVADTFDAAGGGRGDRARMLEIMRDSRIGAHGAVALGLLLLAKWAATAELVQADAWRALLLSPMLARALAVMVIRLMPYARDAGLGTPFDREARWHHVALALLWLLPVLWPPGLALWPACLAACVATALVCTWARSRLGGMTGDLYGTVIELSELAALMTATACA